MAVIHAYAASSAKSELKPFEFEAGPLRDEQVEIAVEFCGICHSDLSIKENEWGITSYPFVPGHEVVGKIVAVGAHIKRAKVGQRVGLGWYAESCMCCSSCLSGDQNLCPKNEQTIIGRHGGFADRVRCHWAWATPLPEALDPKKAGPLLCGGVTVFNPMIQCEVMPTDRVGVIGIGGLGHLAVQFLNRWGCEVVAFTSSDSKRAEVLELGAHHAVNLRDDSQTKGLIGGLDFILCTANANMDWNLVLSLLAPRGKLHFVGVVPDPIPAPAFPLISGQKSISGSPLGSPAITAQTLEFCARHAIAPVTEHFKMSQVNEAMARLKEGKARYRIVLENDLM